MEMDDDCRLAEISVANYRRWIYGLRSYDEILKSIKMNDQTNNEKELMEDIEKLKKIMEKNNLRSVINYFDDEIEKLQHSIAYENCPIQINKKQKTNVLKENKENIINNRENIHDLDKEEFDLSFLNETTGGRSRRHRKHKRKTRKARKTRRHRK